MLRHDMLMLATKRPVNTVVTAADIRMGRSEAFLSCSCLNNITAREFLTTSVPGCVTLQASTPGQASTPARARTMAASQEPPWHGMRGMTRITSEFKVDGSASSTPSCCCQETNPVLSICNISKDILYSALQLACCLVVVAQLAPTECACST